MNGIEKTKVIQIGVLTANIEKTIGAWAKFLGQEAPPIHQLPPYEESHALYNGEPCYGLNRQAFFEFGNVQLEIIEPLGDAPSYWRDCLEKNGEGLHHLAFGVKDLDGCMRSMEAAGFGTGAQAGDFPGGRYGYMDATGSMNMIIEFLEFFDEK